MMEAPSRSATATATASGTGNGEPGESSRLSQRDGEEPEDVDVDTTTKSSGCCGRGRGRGRKETDTASTGIGNNNRRSSIISTNTNSDADFKLNEKPRACTDVMYLIIYVLFCLLMSVIAVFAINYGNPLRLINGMDSYGNICGFNNKDQDLNVNMSFTGMDMRKKSLVFFFDLTDMDQSTRICVEKCPDVDLHTAEDLLNFYRHTSINLCQYDYDFHLLEKSNSSSLMPEICPQLPYYASHPIMKRCIPKPSTFQTRLAFNAYKYLNSLNIFKVILGDLAVTWPTVLMLSSLSFVFSCIFICIFLCMTGAVSYIILVLAVGLSAGFTGFLWWTFVDMKNMLDNMPTEQILEEYKKNEEAFFSYSILSTIFTVVLFLVTVYLGRRVTIVIQLFREAGRALRAIPWLFLQPFITYAALISFMLSWLLVMLCLATSDFPASSQRSIPFQGLHEHADTEHNNLNMAGIGNPQKLVQDQDQHVPAPGVVLTNRTVSIGEVLDFPGIEYTDTIWVKYMWWVYVIGLVWVSEFILACQQMIIASAVSTWYFSRNRPKLQCVVGNAIGRLIKYNLGSVAFGSLVITVVKIPRLILGFTQRVLGRWSDWKCGRLLMQGCTICMACFENCLKYMHHNAYTVVAIQGVDFCPASRLAYTALTNNSLQIGVLNTVGDFILFLAKCITATLTGIIAILVFQSDETLYFYAVPVFLTFVFSYFISHAVISVFEMAVDTLFLCFCEDHNLNRDYHVNDVTDAKTYYAPPSLLRFMTQDAIDALAPGRRENFTSEQSGQSPSPTKARLEDPTANAEELVPMNRVAA